MDPILLADTREEENEEKIDLKSPESILVWVIRLEEDRLGHSRWKSHSVEHAVILSGAPGVTGAASYELSYGCGLAELARNLIDDPSEGWWVIEGITGAFYKGDGWSTDDDMDFYCEGVRPATAQEIYENMTTEEMIAELRARGDTALDAIALELAMLGKLRLLAAEFIERNKISCPETIHQTDRVAETSPEFIERLCDEVGYYKDPELEGDE